MLFHILGLVFFEVPGANAAAAVRPHLKRTGANLVTNPDVNGVTGWDLGGDAIYDSTVSRDEGTGSFRMTTPYPSTERSYAGSSGLIPVESGKVYTFSAYTKTDAWPSILKMYSANYDANRNFIANNNEFARIAVSLENEWQENTQFIVPDINTKYLQIKIIRTPAPRDDGHIWLDNFYFGEGIGFEQPPTPKVPFEGGMTRVDELGNVELFKNGRWESFFPICVYGDPYADYNVFSQQGFNCSMTGANDLLKYKNAISDFNPDGMYAGFNITAYVEPGSASFNNTVLMSQRLMYIKNAGLMDHLLWYYWDNETDQSVYDTWKNVTDTIKAFDVDESGKRLHPIYALLGERGITRMYGKAKFVDIFGDYMNVGHSGTGTGPTGLTIMNNIEQQTNPVVVGQVNIYGSDLLSSAVWRRRFYDIILSGGKGIGWWRECVADISCPDYSAWGLVPFAQTGLYTELPKLRREIDAMMPIIREPEWTDWSFASSDATLRYGTREHNGEGYLIVLNTQDVPITTTLSTTDLPYVPTLVADYFTGSQVTTYQNSQFTISLEANATAVYKLTRPEPSVFANDSLKVANKKVTFGQAKKINTKSKTISFKGANSLIANGSVQLYRGGALVQTTPADATGAWNIKVKEKKDTTVTFYLRYLDGAGTELGTSAGYKIKIDTQKPKITNLPIFLTKTKGAKIWWEAKDNIKVTSYKISFLGKTKTTKSKAFTVPLDTPAGLHILNLKASDAVGNSTSRIVTVRVR